MKWPQLINTLSPLQTFSSIDEMVSTYLKEPITLVNGKCALLKYSPSKPVCHVPNTH